MSHVQDELKMQINQIRLAVQEDFPKGLILHLLDTLEVYIEMAQDEQAQQPALFAAAQERE